MNEPLIRADGVSMTFGEGELATRVLEDVSFELRAGELVLLFGPSGSGKTTLVSILAGLLQPTVGEVELCGASVTRMSVEEVARVRRRALGFVFQNYNLFPALTALENVSEVLIMKGHCPTSARDVARRWLVHVGLGERLHHRPGELSGGQKQRVAIARALADDPPVVIGDEVTAALDSESATRVMELLRGCVDARRSVLLVTHDHRWERFADRIVEMRDGRIACDRPATIARAS